MNPIIQKESGLTKMDSSADDAKDILVPASSPSNGGGVVLDDHEVAGSYDQIPSGIKGRKFSWAKLRRVDSLNLEAGKVSSVGHAGHGSKKLDWMTTLSLAFQSIGVIYGDIGTSPLYTFDSSFPNGIKNLDDVLGVLSLMIYTIVLVPAVKYVFIVLWANDNGDGGTFALYSLICRHAKVSLIPNQQPEDREVSNYNLEIPTKQLERAEMVKQKLETSYVAKTLLFLVSILGTSMVIGDGVLTPCISVLSAVTGISSLKEGEIVGISIAILILLFSFQRFGTDKVGFTFAPIITLWFFVISLIGIYNLARNDIGVVKAFNPKYIVDYFKRNGKEGWISLGGVVLVITGTEAMFADLGHFSVRAVQISFSGMVLPSLLTAYIGQAAYLMNHPDDIGHTFYRSVPSPIYWPTFVIAVAAAIIASQAMISGAFSIISQSLALGCFPRVQVIHTSAKYEGQVYIPEINFLLMIACIIVTGSFKTTEKIGNAYGIAVVAVMVITTCLVTLIMTMIWRTSIWWIALFFLVYMSVDLIYLSSVLYKFKDGGYLPLAIALVLMTIMAIWHYAHKQRYLFELNNKVSNEFVRDMAKNPEIKRIPGIGLLYSELVQGIPPIFPHFISNIPSLHSVIVIVSIKPIPISKVALEERFLFRQVEPRDYRVFRCVVRYGYNDKLEEPQAFEQQLVDNLKEFIRHQYFILEDGQGEKVSNHVNMQQHSGPLQRPRGSNSSSTTVHAVESPPQEQQRAARVSSGSIQPFNPSSSSNSVARHVTGTIHPGAEEEVQIVQKAMDQGVFYLLGEAEVVANRESSPLKKFVINYAYSFLRKNVRQGGKLLAIPRNKLLRVGMVYEV